MTFSNNKIYNEDCRDTLKRMIKEKAKVDLVLTSPFYNAVDCNARSASNATKLDLRARYDVYLDQISNDEYIDFTVDLFKSFDKVLRKDGVVLWNLSYSDSNPMTVYNVISAIDYETPFTTADCLIWKKGSSFPAVNKTNRLWRVCEFVFVLCRKTELDTFRINKRKSSDNKTCGERYTPIPNLISAPNNDGQTTDLNRATFSTDLVTQLLKIYAFPKYIVYDPFMGTGTTAVAAKRLGLSYVGSEISKAQCEYAEKRLAHTAVQKFLIHPLEKNKHG